MQNETIEQRMAKLQKLGAGDSQCFDCLNIAIGPMSLCKKCIHDTPEFTSIMNRLVHNIENKHA